MSCKRVITLAGAEECASSVRKLVARWREEGGVERYVIKRHLEMESMEDELMDGWMDGCMNRERDVQHFDDEEKKDDDDDDDDDDDEPGEHQRASTAVHPRRMMAAK
jgi:hypothetical protein